MRQIIFLTMCFIAVNAALADEFIPLQCETTVQRASSFKPTETGKSTLGVTVVLNAQAIRRILVYGDGKKLAVLETAKNTQLKNHTVVDTSDKRRWNVYNTWEVALGEPASARVNIDRATGEIALETKVHQGGGDWESSVYSGNCDKVGGNNTKF